MEQTYESKLLFEPTLLTHPIQRGNDFLSRNKDLANLIFEYLDDISLCRLARCSWYFKILADHDKYWQPLYFRVHSGITLVPHYSRWPFSDFIEQQTVESGREEASGQKLILAGYGWKYIYQLPVNFETIISAYQRAGAGDFIFLSAGRYDCREFETFYLLPSLGIHMPIHIIGQPCNTFQPCVIIESTDNTPLRWSAESGTVSNIYFHQHQAQQKYYTFAVKVTGTVWFKNCAFTSDSHTAVALDEDSITKFSNCSFIGSDQSGLNIMNATTVVEHCSFYDNKLSGLVIDKGTTGRVLVNHCQIYNNTSGIEICDRSFACIQDNNIMENKEFGLQIRLGDAKLEGNRIHDNKTFGLIAWTDNLHIKNRLDQSSANNNLYDNYGANYICKLLPRTTNDDFDFFITTALNDQVCSLIYTGRHYHKQRWFKCITCHVDGIYGCCETCAKTCHKDHNLQDFGVTSAFCDCPLVCNCQHLSLSHLGSVSQLTTSHPFFKQPDFDYQPETIIDFPPPTFNFDKIIFDNVPMNLMTMPEKNIKY